MSVITLEELKNYWKNVSDWITGDNKGTEEEPIIPHLPEVSVSGTVSVCGANEDEQIMIKANENGSLQFVEEDIHLETITFLEEISLIDTDPLVTAHYDLSKFKSIKWFFSNTHDVDIEVSIKVNLKDAYFFNKETKTWDTYSVTIPANTESLIIPNGFADGVLDSGYGLPIGLEIVAQGEISVSPPEVEPEEDIEEFPDGNEGNINNEEESTNGTITIEAWGEPI